MHLNTKLKERKTLNKNIVKILKRIKMSQDLAGFVCPLCKILFESIDLLKTHYETTHEGPVTWSSNLRKSMQSLWDKALGRPTSDVTKPTETDLRTRDLLELFTGKTEREKVKLVSRSYTNYWCEMRSASLEKEGKETDKILRNLMTFLSEKSEKPLTWKKVKNECNETSNKGCSSCQKTFKLTRRKHTCKLCGVALCDSCSLYLDENIATALVSECDVVTNKASTLRHCGDCSELISFIIKRNIDFSDSKFMELYNEMQNLKRQVSQTVLTYKEIHQSLIEGKNIHDKTQAVIVRAHIEKRGKEIALLGERIANLPVDPDTRHADLQLKIRKAADDFVKELLALSPVPSEEVIEEARQRRLSNLSAKSHRSKGLQWDDIFNNVVLRQNRSILESRTNNTSL